MEEIVRRLELVKPCKHSNRYGCDDFDIYLPKSIAPNPPSTITVIIRLDEADSEEETEE